MLRNLEILGLTTALICVVFPPATRAASPPSLLSYQGVLRDAQGAPLNGSYDVVFRFFDAAAAGNEILVDRHQAVSGGRVTVTGGLFATTLGGGAVEDGSGPGTYATLAEVFRDFDGVWLGVEIGGETLTPRAPVLASAFALNAAHLGGKAAGQFLDVSSTAQTKAGRLVVDSTQAGEFGVTGQGMAGGGYFKDNDGAGLAQLGAGDTGILTNGSTGGYFYQTGGSSYAYTADSNYGVRGFGTAAGGYFEDLNASGVAYVGNGEFGIQSFGNGGGGYFADLDQSGRAWVGFSNNGIEGYGSNLGGYFKDSDGSGYSYVGYGNIGIWGRGSEKGGDFKDTNGSGRAFLGTGDFGTQAFGNVAAGYFEATGGGVAYAYLGHHQTLDGFPRSTGITAYGMTAGGFFQDLSTGTYTFVAGGSYKVSGSGVVSFVQNHPERSDQVIVYSAPEASEVAVYTRGSARLEHGGVRVALDPSFQWVADPDIGLTAHVTETEPSEGLYVASISTTELVVREKNGGTSDSSFDYLVFGLRIGFEEAAVVQPKQIESYIPSMKDHREIFRGDASLRRFNALERFKAMAASTRGADAIDMSRAEALKAAIGEYDPDVHGPVGLPLDRAGASTGEPREGATDSHLAPEEAGAQPRTEERTRRPGDPPAPFGEAVATDGPAWVPVAAVVRAGELLALDSDHPGILRPSATMADPLVVGVASGDVEDRDGICGVRVATGGFAEVLADAAFGPIRPGDLLTASPTPGHAMRALEALPGTVVGKAMQALESGTGTIRVLLMPR